MEKNDLYRTYSAFLMKQYGEKVYKIPLHLPAGCPNRDGTLGTGGCDFCDQQGAGFELLPHWVSVKKQIADNITYIGEKYHAQKFVAYFQNYSNTYLPFHTFQQAMMDAVHPQIVEFAVSTRPDCIQQQQLDVLSKISSETGINMTFELGLQTANYRTLYAINRGHGLAAFIDAVQRLHQRAFNVCAHVIVNLPGDDLLDVTETARILSALRIQQVKLHALYVMKNTKMGDDYLRGELKLIPVEEYIERVICFLENLHPEVIVQRLIGRAPEENSLFVNWGMSWWKIRDEIHEKMIRENRFQGTEWLKTQKMDV
jgi:radical SAM protein (TIGR01212 family)